MKRTALVVLPALIMIVLVSAAGWAQEDGQPRGVFSLQAGGALVAPAGLELEFLLGSVGLSLETRLGAGKSGVDWSGAVEPGINLRFYFGGIDRSLFLFTGAGFLSLWQLSPFGLEQGIVKPRAGLGYSWLLGEQERWRLLLEVGTAWLQEVIEGDLYDIQFPLVPHLLVGFGRKF
jgi:hypothetical protein